VSWLNKGSERGALAALAKDKASNLSGEAKPLPDRIDGAFVLAGKAMVFGKMAGARSLSNEHA
jgi:hypothetical protein